MVCLPPSASRTCAPTTRVPRASCRAWRPSESSPLVATQPPPRQTPRGHGAECSQEARARAWRSSAVGRVRWLASRLAPAPQLLQAGAALQAGAGSREHRHCPSQPGVLAARRRRHAAWSVGLAATRRTGCHPAAKSPCRRRASSRRSTNCARTGAAHVLSYGWVGTRFDYSFVLNSVGTHRTGVGLKLSHLFSGLVACLHGRFWCLSCSGHCAPSMAPMRTRCFFGLNFLALAQWLRRVLPINCARADAKRGSGGGGDPLLHSTTT
jgi:hypothetical protein